MLSLSNHSRVRKNPTVVPLHQKPSGLHLMGIFGVPTQKSGHSFQLTTNQGPW
jgi:hypothetical protein